MKFLCLCYYDVEAFSRLSQAQMEKLGPACKPFDEALYKTGKVMVASLSAPEMWKTIQPQGGKPAVTAGPHLAQKDQAGAFLIIEAADMDEAVRIASLHPAANLNADLGWAIDVRACETFDSHLRD